MSKTEEIQRLENVLSFIQRVACGERLTFSQQAHPALVAVANMSKQLGADKIELSRQLAAAKAELQRHPVLLAERDQALEQLDQCLHALKDVMYTINHDNPASVVTSKHVAVLAALKFRQQGDKFRDEASYYQRQTENLCEELKQLKDAAVKAEPEASSDLKVVVGQHWRYQPCQLMGPGDQEMFGLIFEVVALAGADSWEMRAVEAPHTTLYMHRRHSLAGDWSFIKPVPARRAKPVDSDILTAWFQGSYKQLSEHSSTDHTVATDEMRNIVKMISYLDAVVDQLLKEKET